MADVRREETLSRQECLYLLGSVPLGRVVFTHLGLPAIRPVSHLVEGDQVVIRAHLGKTATILHGAAGGAGGFGGTVVAYQADSIRAGGGLSWAVTVVGRAWRLPETASNTRYREALAPWAGGPNDTPDDIIAIAADIVDGFRLVRSAGSYSGAA